jgi:hypothetical protein
MGSFPGTVALKNIDMITKNNLTNHQLNGCGC